MKEKKCYKVSAEIIKTNDFLEEEIVYSKIFYTYSTSIDKAKSNIRFKLAHVLKDYRIYENMFNCSYNLKLNAEEVKKDETK